MFDSYYVICVWFEESSICLAACFSHDCHSSLQPSMRTGNQAKPWWRPGKSYQSLTTHSGSMNSTVASAVCMSSNRFPPSVQKHEHSGWFKTLNWQCSAVVVCVCRVYFLPSPCVLWRYKVVKTRSDGMDEDVTVSSLSLQHDRLDAGHLHRLLRRHRWSGLKLLRTAVGTPGSDRPYFTSHL